MNFKDYIAKMANTIDTTLTTNHVADKHGNLLCMVHGKVSYNKNDAASKYCHACNMHGITIRQDTIADFMTSKEITNLEVKSDDKIVQIKLKNLCNTARCTNMICVKAGVKRVYVVLYHGSFKECESHVGEEYGAMLEVCMQLSTGSEAVDDFTVVTKSEEGFVVKLDDGSFVFINKTNVDSLMTYPRPGGVKTITFNHKSAPKKRNIFSKHIVKKIKSP